MSVRDPAPLTTAGFDAALAARGITPAPADRDAALTIALFLDGCTRLLRAAVPEGSDGRD